MDEGLDLSGAAFWLALGAVIVASILSRWLRERELQRTIRASIEKFGHIDPALVRLIEEREATQRIEHAAMWGSGEDGAGNGGFRKVAAILIAIPFGVISLMTFLVVGVGLMIRSSGPPPYDSAQPLLMLLPGLGAALVVATAGWMICRAIWGKKPKPPTDPEAIA